MLHGLLNTFGVRLVALFNDVSVWWHVFGVLIVVLVLVFIPDQHTSFSSMFSWTDSTAALTPMVRRHRGFVNYSGFATSPIGFLGITPYIFLIGLLLAQYTITGYDASAHMTEETHDAAVSGPRGIWKSVVISVFFGYILLLGGELRGAARGRLPDRARVPVPDHGEPRRAGVRSSSSRSATTGRSSCC